PFDRCGGALRAGEDASDRGAAIKDREQHVGAVLVADAGFRRRKPDARNFGHVGDVGRGERGDGVGHRISGGESKRQRSLAPPRFLWERAYAPHLRCRPCASRDPITTGLSFAKGGVATGGVSADSATL